MKEIPIKKYVRTFFGVSIMVFILNKLWLRPWVLKNELPEFLQIIVFSIPNLLEAIIGTLILTGILLHLRQYLNGKTAQLKDTYIYLIATCISSIYVISQELKFHNFGGNNVYDPYDLIASIIGLTMTFGILYVFGFADKVET